MRKTKILITGAFGQIGTELTVALRERYGRENVLATDLYEPMDQHAMRVPYQRLDVLDKQRLQELVEQYEITQVYHLVAVLSAKGETTPGLAWHLNTQSLLNVLEVARAYRIEKIFWPSSIAVFGPDAPKENCPQQTVLNPSTIYGITKLAGEQLCAWYQRQYGLDIRSLRYPGLISHSAPAGGGTTDYAVAIFHEAICHREYTCFLKADTRLPMLYMADAVKATLQLMEAPKANLKHLAYNIAGLSFTPEELAGELRNYLPTLKVAYAPDARQEIAGSWPKSIDDQAAREDWHWHPEYELDTLAADMLQHLTAKKPQEAIFSLNI